MLDFLKTVKKGGEHGAAFQYKSVDTEVVGWVLQRVMGKSFAELVSEKIWRNIGAEQDALDALRKHFADNEVAEITLLAGTYVLCAAFLKSLQVPLDDGPVDWGAADAYIKKEGL